MSVKNRKLSRSYHLVKGHGVRHIKKRPYLLPMFGALLGITIVAGVVSANGGQTYQANSSHVVFLYDKGKKQTLDTKAKTVGELINKLPLHLIPQDVVEPSKNSEIVEDNFRVNIYRARPVTIIDEGGNKQVTVTAQKSPRVVAQEAGLKIYPEDITTFAQGTLQENILGEKVDVARSKPVFFNLYGAPVAIRTQSKTVASLLKEKKIKIDNQDQVHPLPDTPIIPGMQVFVVRAGMQITMMEEAVDPPTQIIQDANLSLGATATRQVGSQGRRVVTYQIQKDAQGKEINRSIIQNVVVQEPVPNIIVRGTRVLVNGDKSSWMAQAGISSSDYGYVNFVISHESNWNVGSLNGSGCAGLGQACPGSKLANACPGWQNNPVCQLKFFSGYSSRYGGWSGAYNFWLSHHYW